jgi:hypothetical protein
MIFSEKSLKEAELSKLVFLVSFHEFSLFILFEGIIEKKKKKKKIEME